MLLSLNTPIKLATQQLSKDTFEGQRIGIEDYHSLFGPCLGLSKTKAYEGGKEYEEKVP